MTDANPLPAPVTVDLPHVDRALLRAAKRTHASTAPRVLRTIAPPLLILFAIAGAALMWAWAPQVGAWPSIAAGVVVSVVALMVAGPLAALAILTFDRLTAGGPQHRLYVAPGGDIVLRFHARDPRRWTADNHSKRRHVRPDQTAAFRQQVLAAILPAAHAAGASISLTAASSRLVPLYERDLALALSCAGLPSGTTVRERRGLAHRLRRTHPLAWNPATAGNGEA